MAGPAGGGLYTSKADVYCRTAVGATSPTFTLEAQCDDADDLPLSGSCDGVAESDVELNVSRQIAWAGDNQDPAGWRCTWFYTSARTDPLASARSEICCIEKP